MKNGNDVSASSISFTFQGATSPTGKRVGLGSSSNSSVNTKSGGKGSPLRLSTRSKPRTKKLPLDLDSSL